MAQRYTGLDGKVQKMTLGTPINGDGIAALDAGFYIADVVLDSGSGLPGGATDNYMFYTPAATITPETGETVTPVTFEDMCFVQNATLNIALPEIDITTACDEVNTYDVGRADISGTLNGITDDSALFLEIQNKGIPTNIQEADYLDQVVSDVNGDPIYIYINKNKNARGDYAEFGYLFPAKLTAINNESNTDGATAQTFTADYRITNDDNVKTQLFVLKQS